MGSIEALEHRLARLEEKLCRQRRLAWLAAIGGAAILSLGLTKSDRVVEARALILVDDSGKPRGQLAVSEEGASSLMLTGTSPGTDAGLTVGPGGTLALLLRSPKRTATLEITPDGSTRLRLNRTDARATVELGFDHDGKGRAVISDAAGKVLFQAPAP